MRRIARISFPLGFMGGLNRRLSGTENVRYIADLYGIDADEVEAFCRWCCDIEEYFDQPVGTYSSGMRARLSFALLLVLDFDCYLIDEGMPSTTDVAFNRRAGRLLKERLATATVVIVSHKPEILERFAHRAGVLSGGTLHMFDSLDEARRLYDYAA